jgi:GNAT superfamily N-acetyltransferase
MATPLVPQPHLEVPTRSDGRGVRFWQPGDTEAINRLYNDPQVRPGAKVNGYEPRTAAQWSWEYAAWRRHPPPFVVGLCADRVIGTQAYYPVELLHDGRLMLSGKDEETLIHPDHRGIGLLDDMYKLLFQRARQDGVAVLWGFTNTAVRPLLRNGYHRVGWFEALRADLSGRQRGSPPSRIESLRSRFRRLREADRPGSRASDLAVHQLTDPDERCDRFSFEFGRQVGGVMLHLSAKFLRWRLFDNPFRKHVVFAAYRADRMVGLSAFKLDDRQATGYVSELVAVPTESQSVPEILRALLTPGLELFRARGYEVAEARPSGGHPFNQTVRSVLAEHGFVDVPRHQATEFLVRPTAPSDTQLLDMDRWRISEIMREY